MTHSCIKHKIYLPGKASRNYVRQDCKLVAKTCSTSPYSKKLSQEKILQIGENFSWRKLSRIARWCHQECHAPKFRRENFHEYLEFRKKFSPSKVSHHTVHIPTRLCCWLLLVININNSCHVKDCYISAVVMVKLHVYTIVKVSLVVLSIMKIKM